MPWFYNSYSDELTHATGVDALAYEAAIHTGTGWHELKVPDSATEQQAAADAVKEVPGGTTPTTSLKTGLANVPTQAVPAVASKALSSLLGGSSANWLLRIAEMLLGLALVAVGVARLTRAVPAATAVARQIGAR